MAHEGEIKIMQLDPNRDPKLSQHQFVFVTGPMMISELQTRPGEWREVRTGNPERSNL
jgi:hypothetical protein